MLLTIGPPILRCLRRPSRAFTPTRRFYHNGHSQLRFHNETVKVGVGNNGYITLDILHPILKGSATSPLDAILYLPPGPLFLPPKSKIAWEQPYNGSDDIHVDHPLPSPQHILASRTLSTIVTLNYRLGSSSDACSGEEGEDSTATRQFTFPTPIHDTLTGFDWIYRHVKPRRLCVYGTNVGGSLALMLGLTEPQSVHAIVAEEPVCDWAGLDGYCLPAPEASGNDGGAAIVDEISDNQQETKKRAGKRKAKKGPATAHPDLVPLLEARRQFFRKPENYFDSFASPALFIRSAGKDCPAEFPTYLTGPDYPVPVQEKIPTEELEMEEEFGVPSKPVRRRKALSRWPPYGLDYRMGGERQILSGSGASRTVEITLPWVRLFVHSNKEDPEQKVDESSTSEESGIISGIENLNLDGSSSEDARSSPTPEPKNGRSKTRKRPTEAGLGEESVLAGQGVEMASLLRAACFFGREKGFGEERVKVVRVPIPNNRSIELERQNGDGSLETAPGTGARGDSVVEQAGEWFYEILERGS